MNSSTPTQLHLSIFSTVVGLMMWPVFSPIQVRQFSSFTMPVEFCSHFANKFHLEFVNKFHLVDRNKNLNSWSAAQQQSKVAIQTCILCHHSSACFMINWWIFWYQTGYEMMLQSRILVDRHFCWILQQFWGVWAENTAFLWKSLAPIIAQCWHSGFKGLYIWIKAVHCVGSVLDFNSIFKLIHWNFLNVCMWPLGACSTVAKSQLKALILYIELNGTGMGKAFSNSWNSQPPLQTASANLLLSSKRCPSCKAEVRTFTLPASSHHSKTCRCLAERAGT